MTNTDIRILCMIVLIGGAPAASARAEDFGSPERWCADSLGYCWGQHDEQPGFRIVADLSLGAVVTFGGNTGIINPSAMPNVGIELALYGGWTTMHLLFFGPMQLSAPAETGALLAGGGGAVGVNFGGSVGFTALEGILTIGVGLLAYNAASFEGASGLPSEGFVYFGIQPVSAVRALFVSFH